jgi:hypothetical protein
MAIQMQGFHRQSGNANDPVFSTTFQLINPASSQQQVLLSTGL